MILPIHKLKKGSVFKVRPGDKQMYILDDFNGELLKYICFPYCGRRRVTLFLDADQAVTVMMMFY